MTNQPEHPCTEPTCINNPDAHPYGFGWDPSRGCAANRTLWDDINRLVKQYADSTEFESFFDRHEDDPDYTADVVDAYMTARSGAKDAHAAGNYTNVRRHRGELDAANAQIDRMDIYAAHHTLTRLHMALTNELEQELTGTPDLTAAPTTITAPTDPATEDTQRFGGHAPNYRRGRAYALNLEAAARGAIDNRPAFSTLYEKQADTLLGPLGNNNDPEDLRDFIAGVAREAELQLERLRNHFCTTTNGERDPQ